jgi:hypothetical protein
MRRKFDAQEILNMMDYLDSCCQTITEGGGCTKCPLWATCLDDNDFTDVANSFNKNHWDDFIALAEDIEDYVSDEDMRANEADMRRKGERDGW